MELERNQEKLEREITRLNECKMKLMKWQLRAKDRDNEIDKF